MVRKQANPYCTCPFGSTTGSKYIKRNEINQADNKNFSCNKSFISCHFSFQDCATRSLCIAMHQFFLHLIWYVPNEVLDRGELANSYTGMMHNTKMALYIIINRSLGSSRRLITLYVACMYIANCAIKISFKHS